ncbi:MAG: ester cyclase [Trueperaceae bacterium]
MKHQATEDLVNRWHNDLFTAGNLDAAEDIVTTDFVAHVAGRDFHGVAGAKEAANFIRTAFPDAVIQHHDVVASEDRVAIRWVGDGTHRGDYAGVPATGKRIHIEGIDMFHVENGKITEVWVTYDNLGVLQTMGVIPVGEAERPLATA